MAFKLTRQTNGNFQGAAGQRVQVDVQSDGPASTVRITYAAEQDGDAPFEFKIQKGENKLLVVALGGKNDQRMEVVEADGGNTSRLKRFFWSKTHFHTTLDIEGV